MKVCTWEGEHVYPEGSTAHFEDDPWRLEVRGRNGELLAAHSSWTSVIMESSIDLVKTARDEFVAAQARVALQEAG